MIVILTRIMLSLSRNCIRKGIRVAPVAMRSFSALFNVCEANLLPSVRFPLYGATQMRFYRRNDSIPPITKTNPELLLLWHPTKNIGIRPEEVTIKSFQKVWWKCPKGVDHEWQASIRYMVDKDNKYVGCPFCNNKRVSITNSLSTKYPEIAAQWHPTKNNSLLPSAVTYTSTKNVWWQCEKGHEWKRPINQRVNPKTPTQRLRLGRG